MTKRDTSPSSSVEWILSAFIRVWSNDLWTRKFVTSSSFSCLLLSDIVFLRRRRLLLYSQMPFRHTSWYIRVYSESMMSDDPSFLPLLLLSQPLFRCLFDPFPSFMITWTLSRFLPVLHGWWVGRDALERQQRISKRVFSRKSSLKSKTRNDDDDSRRRVSFFPSSFLHWWLTL